VFTGDGLGNKEIAPGYTHRTAFRGRWLDKERLTTRRRILKGFECRDDPGQQKRLFLSAGIRREYHQFSSARPKCYGRADLKRTG